MHDRESKGKTRRKCSTGCGGDTAGYVVDGFVAVLDGFGRWRCSLCWISHGGGTRALWLTAMDACSGWDPSGYDDGKNAVA